MPLPNRGQPHFHCVITPWTTPEALSPVLSVLGTNNRTDRFVRVWEPYSGKIVSFGWTDTKLDAEAEAGRLHGVAGCGAKLLDVSLSPEARYAPDGSQRVRQVKHILSCIRFFTTVLGSHVVLFASGDPDEAGSAVALYYAVTHEVNAAEVEEWVSRKRTCREMIQAGRGEQVNQEFLGYDPMKLDFGDLFDAKEYWMDGNTTEERMTPGS